MELEAFAASHSLNKSVFLRNVSEKEKTLLLQRSQVVLYTPINEVGMGIVPIEAMSLGCLVIACNRGAQLESISHDYTGFVLPDNEQIWGD